MKILLYDKLQDSTGLPDELLTPDLSDVCEDAPPFTVTFEEATTINCLGIGNTDATQIDITGDFDAVSVMIDKAAPWQNGLYLVDLEVYNIDEFTLRSTPIDSLSAVCWAPELSLFCAVSYYGIITSPDGITWTLRTSGVGWTDVCWSPELNLFCVSRAFYTGGNDKIATSPDGITWTLRNIATTDFSWLCVCWSPELELFCVGGATDISGSFLRLATSPDGVTWTLRTAPSEPGLNLYYSVCWSPELNLFCAITSKYAAISSDGITWSGFVVDTTNSLTRVCWAPELGLFCAVGTSGSDRIAISTDGSAWTTVTAPELNRFTGVCWSPDLTLFCAVSEDGTNRVMFSRDGIEWEVMAAAGDQEWAAICWSPDLWLFCAVGESAMTGGAGRKVSVPVTEMTIDHDGTYIGRLAAGEYRQINTTPRKEIGFFSTNENRKTLAGGVIPGAGGYSGRKVDLDVRYKLTEDILEDIETAYPDQIARGFPFFMLLDDEAFKLPDNMYRFYGTAPITMFQSEIRQFLYSMKFQFTEAF